jgi:hypothetical protein
MTIKYYIDSLLNVNLKCGYVRKGIEYYISKQLRSITTVFMISQKDTDALGLGILLDIYISFL